MASMPSLFVEGTPELVAFMRELGPKCLASATRGMRKAAKPIISGAQKRLTRHNGYSSGLLQQSIGIRVARVDKRQRHAICLIGPRKGFRWPITKETLPSGRVKIRKRPHNPVPLGHLIDRGHRIAMGGKLDRVRLVIRAKHMVNGTGRAVGFVRARPFLTPEFQQHESNSTTIIANQLKNDCARMKARQAKAFVAAQTITP